MACAARKIFHNLKITSAILHNPEVEHTAETENSPLVGESEKNSRRFGVGVLAEVKVDIKDERCQDDEPVEESDPRRRIGDRSKRVDREEDVERKDAQEGQIDAGSSVRKFCGSASFWDSTVGIGRPTQRYRSRAFLGCEKARESTQTWPG